ncbi:hypothetical protein JCM11641_003037 [Rhodosporidiobolus odoratus]
MQDALTSASPTQPDDQLNNHPPTASSSDNPTQSAAPAQAGAGTVGAGRQDAEETATYIEEAAREDEGGLDAMIGKEGEAPGPDQPRDSQQGAQKGEEAVAGNKPNGQAVNGEMTGSSVTRQGVETSKPADTGGRVVGSGAVSEATATYSQTGAPAIVEPTPSNPSLATTSLLLSSESPSDNASSPAEGSKTPPPPSSAPAATARATPSPAPSVSPTPTAPSTATGAAPSIVAPLPQKKFQSSLAVNKKFLEKAGEKAKPEVKPVAARLATPPVPTPVSASHPRLFAGKISSSPSVSLAASTASSVQLGWNKKPVSPSPAPSAPGAPSISASSGARLPGLALVRPSGAVWGAKPSPGGRVMPSLGLGGRRDMSGEFPTAAEAAHAKEARARIVVEQMQAREREMQARAAAAAATNAHLLEGLDAFRGVHLDPNASHWDEDDDDFLDTTIEFADGTQYKIIEDERQPGVRTGEDELREPGLAELALLEKPLAPGEVIEPPKREERFGDDYDRSWPPRAGQAHVDAKNLFNDRLGKFEPAASLPKRPSAPPEPTSILSSSTSKPQSERRTSGTSDLPPHLAHHSSSEAPRRRPSVTSPPRRRPSITSPSTRQIPLSSSGRRGSFGEQQKMGAWGRKHSADWQGRSMPHLSATAEAGPGGNPESGGRMLPPHLHHPQLLPSAPSRSSFSPPSQRAFLPSVQPLANVLSPPAAPAASLPAPPIPATAPPIDPQPSENSAEVPVPDLEATHAREMHAAAERARKRREEEEQQRAEQKERARKKALELEERMKASMEAKVAQEKKSEASTKEPEASAAALADPISPSTTVPKTSPNEQTTSRRAPSKPLPPPAVPAAAQPPTKILARDALPSSTCPVSTSAQTSLPLRPTLSSTAPPTQPAAWRRSTQPSAAPPRAPLRELPPHMVSAAATETRISTIADTTVAGSTAAPPADASASTTTAAPPIPPLAASSPPPAEQTPSSPLQDRRAPTSAKVPYKQPAVSQLDDLMSRIKGVMAAPGEPPRATVADSLREDVEARRPAASSAKLPVPQPPTVKLPSAPSVALPASTPIAIAPTSSSPTVSLPRSAEARGRGRGRIVTPRVARPALPAFESREPILPIHSSRLARSQSPPPAWRQYTIRLAPYPARRPPPARVVKNFSNVHHPRPVNSLAFEPPMPQVNTNRLTRDDWLMPKRYIKGVVQHAVHLPKAGKKLVRQTAEKPVPPVPSVSISSTPLKRAAPPPPADEEPFVEPAPLDPVDLGPAVKPADQVLGYIPYNRSTAPDSGSWRRSGSEAGPATTMSAEDKEADASTTAAAPSSAATPLALPKETSSARPRSSHKNMPEGTSIGFYRPQGALPLDELNSTHLERSSSGHTFMVTSELNGEKVESTPRRETTAPGAHLAKTPTSPAFVKPEANPLLSSPSSAAAWTSKSLVLNPAVASVWSAAPDVGAVHARVASGLQVENSLQGVADVDPIEALPSSLADLKSEDGISTEDRDGGKRTPPRDEAKLRAAAPSFSSFLHEKAASIDSNSPVSAALPAPLALPRAQPLPYPGFPSPVPPQSTPSPINAYSPAQAYSPQIHPSFPQYNRPLSQQQGYPSYPLSAQPISSYVAQPLHHTAYPSQPFAPQSPAVQAANYPPSAPSYRDPTQPVVPPQHITNPALLANFGYGQPATSASPVRTYGAVGAGGPAPIGRPFSSASYPRPPMQQVPPPTNYISPSYGSAYQPPPPPPHRPVMESPYAYGASPEQGRLPYHSGTTMASPVIAPPVPPQVPLFGGSMVSHQGYPPQHQHQGALPSAVSVAAGIPPYAGHLQAAGGVGAYGPPGGYGRSVPAGRVGGTLTTAGYAGRGW